MLKILRKLKYPLLVSILPNVCYSADINTVDFSVVEDSEVAANTTLNVSGTQTDIFSFDASGLTVTNKGTIGSSISTSVPLIRAAATDIANVTLINEGTIDANNVNGGTRLIDLSTVTSSINFTNRALSGSAGAINNAGATPLFFGQSNDTIDLGTFGSSDGTETGGTISAPIDFGDGTSTLRVNRNFTTGNTITASSGSLDLEVRSEDATNSTTFIVNESIDRLKSIALIKGAGVSNLTLKGAANSGVLAPAADGNKITIDADCTLDVVSSGAAINLNAANKWHIDTLNGEIKTTGGGTPVIDLSGVGNKTNDMVVSSTGKITLARGTFQRVNAGKFTNNGTITLSGAGACNFSTTGGEADSAGTFVLSGDSTLIVSDTENSFTNSGTMTMSGASSNVRIANGGYFKNTGTFTSSVDIDGMIRDSGGGGTVRIFNSGTINNNNGVQPVIKLDAGGGVISDITCSGTASTGVITGNIKAGNGVTTLNLGTLNSSSETETAGTITGAIDLGQSTNILNVNRSFTTGGDISNDGGNGNVNVFVKSAGSTPTVFTVENAINSINQLNVEGGSMVVSGGTITPDGAATPLNISGGTLQLIGAKGNANWNLNITNGTLVVGDGSNASVNTLGSAAFDNAGTIRITNQGSLSSGANLINNTGAIDVQTGGTLVATNAITTTGGSISLNGTLDANNLANNFVGGTLSLRQGGVITNNNNTTLDGSSTLNLFLNAGVPEQVSINAGNININGTINVTTSGQVYIGNGDTFDFFSATPAALVTVPATVSNNKIVSFTASSNGNNLRLTATREPLKNSLETPFKEGLADAVDALASAQNTGFIKILSALEVLPQEELEDAIEQLHPVHHGGAASADSTVNNTIASATSQRLASIRKLSYTAGDSLDNAFWIKGYAVNNHQKRRKEVKGYDVGSGGFVFGVDRTVKAGLVFGGNFSIANSRIKSRHYTASRVDVRSAKFGVYGSIPSKHWFLDYGVNFGKNSYKRERFVKVTGIEKVYKAEHPGFQSGVQLDWGYEWLLANTYFIPGLGFSYDYAKQEGYTEREEFDNSTGLIVNSMTNQVALGKLSLGMLKKYKKDDLEIVPNVKLGLWYDFKGQRYTSTARFIGGGEVFATRGEKPAQESFHIDGGVKIIKEDLIFDANLSLEKKDRFTGYGFQASIRYSF